jgi:SAM-dependent methyltransferase
MWQSITDITNSMISDSRKLTTQKDYSIISKMYADDFGADRDHFDFIDDAITDLRNNYIDKFPVVDLGCGSGVVTDYLIEKGLKNIIAIDITPEFCEMVHQNHQDKVEIILGDITDIVHRQVTSSIGAYFASFSIIHIPNEEIEELFMDISRTLVNSGLFIMACHKGTFKGMEQEPYQTQNDPRLKEKRKLKAYMNYFTEKEITNLIEKTGMKIIRMETFEAKPVPGEFPVPKIWLLAQKITD